jgi:hypothetical protein
MYFERFANDRPDTMAGIHTAEWVLKDHLGVPSQSSSIAARHGA